MSPVSYAWTTAWTRSLRLSLARICPTWILIVLSDRCSPEAISRLDWPRASSAKTSRSRSVRGSSRRSRRVVRSGSGSSGTNRSISRRVVVGASTAAPSATVRMAASRSAGGASFSRNPLAPAPRPVEIVGGEDQHLGGSSGGADGGRGLDAVRAGHADVHEHDVRAQRRGHADTCDAVAGLPDHGDIGLGFKDHPEAHPYQRLVIDQQAPDHVLRS